MRSSTSGWLDNATTPATRCTPTAKPGGCFSVSRLRDSSGRWPALRLADLTATEVLAFLDYSEKERHVSIGARNCRLAALGSFFCFVAEREPLAAGQCAEVLRIPTKRGRAAASVIRNLLKSRPFWLISALQIVPDHCCLRPSPGSGSFPWLFQALGTSSRARCRDRNRRIGGSAIPSCWR
jgi:hypothetical protein